MVGSRTRCAAIGTLLAVLVLGPGVAHGAGFLPAQPVNNSNDIVAPSGAIDAVGNILFAWQKNLATAPDHIQGAQFLAGGTAFTALADFSDNTDVDITHNNTAPVVAVNRAGIGIVAWIHNAGGLSGDQIQVVPYQHGGVVGTLQTIHNGGGGDSNLAAAVSDNGNAVIAWMHDGNLIEAVTRAGVGGTFGPDPAQQLLSAGADAPSVAIDSGGNAIVAYANNNLIEGQRHTAGAPAATWATAESPLTTGPTSSGVRVAANPLGQMVVAWLDSTGAGTVREVAGTVSAGWGSPTIEALSPTGVQHGPGVSVDDSGGAAVGWSAASAVQVSLRPAGGAFPTSAGAQTIQTVPATPAFFTLAGAGNGEVIAAWYSFETGAGANVVRAAVKPAGSSAFGASQVISALNPAIESTNPFLAFDPTGDAVAGFQLGNSGAPLGVGAAIYDNTPPQLGAPTGSATVKEGTAASFSDAATDTFSAVSLRWSFGDGSAAASGTQVTHAFTRTGTFTVTVTATDAAGNASSATRTITVTGAPNPPHRVKHCKVPKLKGKTLSRSRTLLSRANCRLGKVHRPKARKHHKLRKLVVGRSAPRVGTVKPLGTKVALTLVQVPKPKPKKHK